MLLRLLLQQGLFLFVLILFSLLWMKLDSNVFFEVLNSVVVGRGLGDFYIRGCALLRWGQDHKLLPMVGPGLLVLVVMVVLVLSVFQLFLELTLLSQ